MTEVAREQVRHVARLARLEVSEEEVARLAVEMSSILGHVAELAKDGDDGEAGPRGRGLAPRLRRDEPDPDPLEREPGAIAPEWREGLFVVPRLPALGVEGEGA